MADYLKREHGFEEIEEVAYAHLARKRALLRQAVFIRA
jgi:hypothetical protein